MRRLPKTPKLKIGRRKLFLLICEPIVTSINSFASQLSLFGSFGIGNRSYLALLANVFSISGPHY